MMELIGWMGSIDRFDRWNRSIGSIGILDVIDRIDRIIRSMDVPIDPIIRSMDARIDPIIRSIDARIDAIIRSMDVPIDRCRRRASSSRRTIQFGDGCDHHDYDDPHTPTRLDARAHVPGRPNRSNAFSHAVSASPCSPPRFRSRRSSPRSYRSRFLGIVADCDAFVRNTPTSRR